MQLNELIITHFESVRTTRVLVLLNGQGIDEVCYGYLS
jgi:hypothetical protein